ncbi:uncharacterized protein [Procambarus clarkii]|uniref:uncharacterized protein n=1 Tax=Procambarus clarkii TaxID=6728 RepID=UPI003744699F
MNVQSFFHFTGSGGPEEADRPFLCGDDLRHDMRYDPQPEPRTDLRHDPPLDLRGDVRDQRIDPRADIRGEIQGGGDRLGSSPPLPPSSLPHSCQLCGKLISCRRNLWKHMERVHFNNPAVRCSLCAKMFKNKYALKDHQRIYHGGLSEPPPPPPHSASLLSRILQDPRHQQPPQSHDHRGPPPLEMSQPTLLPRDSHLRHHMDSSHTQAISRRHHEDEDVGGGAAYPGMGIGTMIPQSLAPTIVGSPSSLSGPRPEWPAQDNPLALVNRALLTELHHLVTKAD